MSLLLLFGGTVEAAPPDDTFDHWASDGWDPTAHPTVGLQTDATDPQPDAPHQEEVAEDEWWAALDASPVGADVVVVEDQPPEDTWGHWTSDGWDHVAVAVTSLATDLPGFTLDPPLDFIWPLDDVEDEWWSAPDSAPVGEDAAAIEEPAQSGDVWPYDIDEFAPLFDWMVVGGPVIEEDQKPEEFALDEETFDDGWWHSLDAGPIGADAIPRPEEVPWEDEFFPDDWEATLDAAPVVADFVPDPPAEDAPRFGTDDTEDDWAVALDASPAGADVPPAETPPIPDDFDHWVSDGWDHTAILGSSLQADAAAVAEEPLHGAPPPHEETVEDDWYAALDASPVGADVAPNQELPPADAPWPHEIDESAALYDWMVVGEPIIEEDPRPEEDVPDYQTHDEDWWHPLDASPVGADAPAAETPPIPDDFDHWVSDGWDHTAILGSSLQSNGADEPIHGDPPPHEETVDDDWWSTLDASPVGPDAAPPEEPGQPDAPHAEETFDEDWWHNLNAAPVGPDSEDDQGENEGGGGGKKTRKATAHDADRARADNRKREEQEFLDLILALTAAGVFDDG